MPHELSVLDKAERGEWHGSLVEDSPGQVDGCRTFESMAQPQPTAVQAQREELGGQIFSPSRCAALIFSLPEQVSGPEGLARVKDYDRRFRFYPSFSVERSLALEFRAEEISRLSLKIHDMRKDINLRSEGDNKPSDPAPTEVVEERLEALMSRLAEKLAQYGE